MSTNICKVDGCGKKVCANGYCAKHNKQVSLYGRTYRTRYDPNEFIFHEDCVEIRMFGYEYENELHEAQYVGSTFIDLDDYDKVKDIKWCLAKDGYAFNYKVGKLHRYIYPNQDEIIGQMVDHIDRNKLNNRKSNLRPANASQNSINRGLNKKGTITNLKNIYLVNDGKTYSVDIIYQGKNYRQCYSFGPQSPYTQEQALQLAINWRNKKWQELDPDYCFTDC